MARLKTTKSIDDKILECEEKLRKLKERCDSLNDEWRKQDEERRNQKAIEEAREKRAKKLAEMDAAERRAWAEKHEKEILEERERFEGEQKDLREIIDAIREKHGEGVQADLEAREKTQK